LIDKGSFYSCIILIPLKKLISEIDLIYLMIFGNITATSDCFLGINSFNCCLIFLNLALYRFCRFLKSNWSWTFTVSKSSMFLQISSILFLSSISSSSWSSSTYLSDCFYVSCIVCSINESSFSYLTSSCKVSSMVPYFFNTWFLMSNMFLFLL
jgi:hypothetical protein